MFVSNNLTRILLLLVLQPSIGFLVHEPQHQHQQQQHQQQRRSPKIGTAHRSHVPHKATSRPPHHQPRDRSNSNTGLSCNPTASDTPATTAIEFWLDIRATAMNPAEAIRNLCGDIGVTVEEPSMQQDLVTRVVAMQELYRESVNAGMDHDMVLLSSGDGILQRGEDSCGSIVPLSTDEPMDIETLMRSTDVVSNGDWIILDAEDASSSADAEKRVAAIESCLDLLTSMNPASPAAMDDSTGLILQTPSDASTNKGGIAIHCPTKTLLMELVARLQSRQMGSSTTMTDSGIMIPRDDSDGDPSDAVASLSSNSVKLAILLPFDFILWQTALVYN